MRRWSVCAWGLLTVAGMDAAVAQPRPAAVVSCGTIDPNRITAAQGYAYLVPYFAADGDTSGAATRSPVGLLEGSTPLGSAHAAHDSIRVLGGGRFSHWVRSLYFSTSDHTDPRTNGRTYRWGVPEGRPCPVQVCGPVDVHAAAHDSGANYILEQSFGFAGDSSGAGRRSSLELFEGTRPLGPAHSLHADIRTRGGGRYSHWGNALYFSTSDNSDPRTNGRSYYFGGNCRILAEVGLTRLAQQAPFFATFGSHNQRIVENAYGLFIAHLTTMYPGPHWKDGNPLDTRADWQLLRSRDRGVTVQRVYAGRGDGTHVPPVLEGDAAGNLYVFAPQFTRLVGGDVDLLEFTAASGFATPNRSTIPGMASDKFSAVYDSAHNDFFYAATGYAPGHPARIAVVGTSGEATVGDPLVVNGRDAFLMYPLLGLGDDGTLFLAWTSQALPRISSYLYWDIHFMESPDRGRTWTTAAGRPLALPIPADSTGPADRVSTPGETGTHPWLAGFLPWAGMLHFAYRSGPPAAGEHYRRFNLSQGRIDVVRSPVFRGNTLEVGGLGGYFLRGDGANGARPRLYFVGTSPEETRIVVLASDDGGRTWFDYAVSRPGFTKIYSLSGPRRIGPSGHLYGVFTDLKTNDESLNANDVWLLSIPGE